MKIDGKQILPGTLANSPSSGSSLGFHKNKPTKTQANQTRTQILTESERSSCPSWLTEASSSMLGDLSLNSDVAKEL